MENEKKYIIIALIVVVLALVAGIAYMMFFNSVEYQTIRLTNGTTLEAPVTDDASWTVNEYGVKMYIAPSAKTSVMSFNSEEDFNLVGAGAFAIARDALLNGSVSVETYKNYDIRQNTLNGTRYYIVSMGNDATHDNIVMGSCDVGILKHMIDSVSFGPPDKAVKNTTSQSQSAASTDISTQNSNNNDKNKYSEDDLMRASQQGYYNGYADGVDDSYYDYDDYYDFSDVETTADSYYSSESSSSSGATVVDEEGNFV